MPGFTKMYSQILDSTVWDYPWEVKGVWITMLLMADQHGNVLSSISGLARRATVTLEQAEAALEAFLAPDKYSRTPDSEGRRIEVIDGGWHLLNYTKYREQRDEEARREQNRLAQQRHRASAKNSDSQHQSAPSAQAEAEAEAEAEKDKATTLAPAEPPAPTPLKSLEVIRTQAGQEAFERVWTAWPATRPDGARAKGHRVEGERAFQKLLDARMATVEELEAAAKLYLAEHPNVAKGYVVNVSTFYGPVKGIWNESVRFLRKKAADEVRA